MGNRRITALLLCSCALSACSAETTATYPLWDGEEPVAAYARRAGLEPVRTFSLAPGVELEMVLIPAGRFKMGAPDAVLPERSMEYAGLRLLLASALVSGLVGWVLVRSIRMRRRPQFSLAYLVSTTCATSLCVWSVLDFHAVQAEWAWYGECLTRSAAMDPNTKPAHGVTLTRPFYLSKHELTEAQYVAVTGCSAAYCNPTDQISPEAQFTYPVGLDDGATFRFIHQLRTRFGNAFRLPSEAEWEFACRAGSKGSFCGKHEGIESYHIYVMRDSFVGPVGRDAPNAFGLYDMHTNIWEWCVDWYAPYRQDDSIDPHGPRISSGRVIRGGRRRNANETCAECCRWMAVGACGHAIAGVRFALDIRDLETVCREERETDLSVTWRELHQRLKLSVGDVEGCRSSCEDEYIFHDPEDSTPHRYVVTQTFLPNPPTQGSTRITFSLLSDEGAASRLIRKTPFRGITSTDEDPTANQIGDERIYACHKSPNGRCLLFLRARRGRLFFEVWIFVQNSAVIPTTQLFQICRKLIERYEAAGR